MQHWPSVLILISLCLVGFIIYFIYLYQQKRQIQNKVTNKDSLRSLFNQELLKTQIEVQEETLNHISREIHDNITQVLSFVKLNLALTGKLTEQDKADKDQREPRTGRANYYMTCATFQKALVLNT
jgi:signal transduction histidine kinase